MECDKAHQEFCFIHRVTQHDVGKKEGASTLVAWLCQNPRLFNSDSWLLLLCRIFVSFSVDGVHGRRGGFSDVIVAPSPPLCPLGCPQLTEQFMLLNSVSVERFLHWLRRNEHLDGTNAPAPACSHTCPLHCFMVDSHTLSSLPLEAVCSFNDILTRQ